MCSLCVTVCPNRANQEIQVTPVAVTAPRYRVRDGGLTPLPEQPVSVTQDTQIVNVADLCNECGNCATFCPTAGAPYCDKPRLHLRREVYEAEGDGGIFCERRPDGGLLLRTKLEGAEQALEVLPGGQGFTYRGPAGTLQLNSALEVSDPAPAPEAPEGALLEGPTAVRLAVLALGIRDSLRPLLS